MSPEKKASSSKASTRPQAYTTAAMKKIAAKMKGDGDIGFKSEDSDQGSDQEEEVGDEEDDGNGEGASSSNAALKSAAIVEFADLVVTAPRGSGTGGGGGWKGGKASASTNAKLCSGLRNVKVFKKVGTPFPSFPISLRLTIES